MTEHNTDWRGKGPVMQPEYWQDPRFGKDRRGYPVVGVSWYEAVAYAAWLTEQLRVAGCGLRVWRQGRLETLSLSTRNGRSPAVRDGMGPAGRRRRRRARRIAIPGIHMGVAASRMSRTAAAILARTNTSRIRYRRHVTGGDVSAGREQNRIGLWDCGRQRLGMD